MSKFEGHVKQGANSESESDQDSEDVIEDSVSSARLDFLPYRSAIRINLKKIHADN